MMRYSESVTPSLARAIEKNPSALLYDHPIDDGSAVALNYIPSSIARWAKSFLIENFFYSSSCARPMYVHVHVLCKYMSKTKMFAQCAPLALALRRRR